jgi:hypothetical protein
MSDQPVAEASTYTGRQGTNIRALIGSPTRDPSNQTAADGAATGISVSL